VIFGNGYGLILKANIIGAAIEKFFAPNNYPIIYLSPKGINFDQNIAKLITSHYKGINILCGRFEGIDERIIKEYNIKEISIGDYILSSGDIACFTFIDCCLRYISGYIGNEKSLQEESFGQDYYKYLLEYPHYTKPLLWKLNKIPDRLISGNHNKICKWKLSQAQKITKNRRPDLWIKHLNGVK